MTDPKPTSFPQHKFQNQQPRTSNRFSIAQNRISSPRSPASPTPPTSPSPSVVPEVTFPPAPENPGVVFPGGDKAAYKEWMKKRLLYQSWENESHLFKMKESEGDLQACSKIVNRITADLLAAKAEGNMVTMRLPTGFPKPPPRVLVFPGPQGDREAYKEWMKSRSLYERWENGLLLYAMRMKEGNKAACDKIIRDLRLDLPLCEEEAEGLSDNQQEAMRSVEHRLTLNLNVEDLNNAFGAFDEEEEEGDEVPLVVDISDAINLPGGGYARKMTKKFKPMSVMPEDLPEGPALTAPDLSFNFSGFEDF